MSETNATSRRGRRGGRLTLAALLLAGCLGLLLPTIGYWRMVEDKAFDLLSVATAPGRSELPITIVAIDEASFAQLGKRWPWPRDLHARLIDRLVDAGAAVIAFDVMFPEAGGEAEDRALADAVARAGNVVLAADRAYHETAALRQWLRIDPLPRFTGAGAIAGLASVTLGRDAVARHMADDEDAFWRQAVRMLLSTRPGIAAEPAVAPGGMLRYLGPPRTFPQVSYYQVLNGDPGIPDGFFRDQIVLIGRDLRAGADVGAAQADMFATPFVMTSRLLTAGVEIQATMLENAMMGQVVYPARAGIDALALAAILLLAWPALARWHPLRSSLLMLALAAGLALNTVWLFVRHNLWPTTGAPRASLAVAWLVVAVGSFLAERRRARDIQAAFSKYVSATVVEQIVAHPENLKLGGERRMLTLLFSDVAGFTSLSERLSPERVAGLMNVYLNEMTRIVMDHGGTVDKFIGDAVMAFWGAPLPDGDHALHAVRAAVAMQERLVRLRPELARFGVDDLRIRVGINSGVAVVGNMGSDLRFDYTALGDNVNLAARLEGINKLYGTDILISEHTAAEVRDRIPLRRIDRVRAKGKTVSVAIFAPCREPGLIEATEAAWRAYARRDWEAAAEAWRNIGKIAPDDPVAAVFEERIARFRTAPPEADWDGSVALDKF